MTTDSPRPPNPLLQAAGRALEASLARALTLDPETRDRLADLDGRQIELHLEAPRLAMRIAVDGRRLRVGPADPTNEPDLSLRASAGALLAQLLPSSDRAAPVGRLRISGDAELAQRVQKLVSDYAPDIDAAFAGVFGDILGVQLARALRGAFGTLRRGAGRFARDGADYLVEERREVASRVEQAIFFDEVDALRDGVDRLAARVERLQRNLAG